MTVPEKQLPRMRATSDAVRPGLDMARHAIAVAEGYASRKSAVAMGVRMAGGFAAVDAILRQADQRWVPIALLRTDQYWMTSLLLERGLPCIAADEGKR